MPAINHVCSTGSRAWRAPTAVSSGLPYSRVGAGHARDQSRLQHQIARMARSYRLEQCRHIPTITEAENGAGEKCVRVSRPRLAGAAVFSATAAATAGAAIVTPKARSKPPPPNSAARRFQGRKEWTVLPPTTVRSTFTLAMSSAGIVSGLRSSTMKSANLPGSSEPVTDSACSE